MPSTNYPNYEIMVVTVGFAGPEPDSIPWEEAVGGGGAAAVPQAESQSVSSATAQSSVGAGG